MNVRQRVWTLLEVADSSDRMSRQVDSFIIGLILLRLFRYSRGRHGGIAGRHHQRRIFGIDRQQAGARGIAMGQHGEASLHGELRRSNYRLSQG